MGDAERELEDIAMRHPLPIPMWHPPQYELKRYRLATLT